MRIYNILSSLLQSSLPCSQEPVTYPYLSHINASHTLLSMPRSSKWFFPSGFSTRTIDPPPPHICHMPFSSHSASFDYPNNIWWTEQIMKRLFLCNFLQSTHTSVWGSNFLSPLPRNTLSLCSSRNVRNQASHPYKTTLILIVLGRNGGHNRYWTKWWQVFPAFNLL
jgi:hypothetical protein